MDHRGTGIKHNKSLHQTKPLVTHLVGSAPLAGEAIVRPTEIIDGKSVTLL